MVLGKIHFGIDTDAGIIRKLVMDAFDTAKLLPVGSVVGTIAKWRRHYAEAQWAIREV